MNKNIINKVVNKSHTIQSILNWTAKCFNAADIWYGHGTDNPWDEALQLILPSLCLPLNISKDIYTRYLTSSEKKIIVEHVISRINERIPVAYLTNKAWFCGHEFYIDKRVLIPRSPIGEIINNNFSSLINKHPQNILDMCTGSGCIAIACAYIFPESKLDAVDISDDALTVAEYNIKLHNLSHQIVPIVSDIFCHMPKKQYNLIVTNPPYVDEKEIPSLPNEYHHEPKLGLISTGNGLEITRRILARASDYLAEDGIIICEVGNSMFKLIEQYPYVEFTWLEFSNGGNGVFMLNKTQLIRARKYLNT